MFQLSGLYHRIGSMGKPAQASLTLWRECHPLHPSRGYKCTPASCIDVPTTLTGQSGPNGACCGGPFPYLAWSMTRSVTDGNQTALEIEHELKFIDFLEPSVQLEYGHCCLYLVVCLVTVLQYDLICSTADLRHG